MNPRIQLKILILSALIVIFFLLSGCQTKTKNFVDVQSIQQSTSQSQVIHEAKATLHASTNDAKNPSTTNNASPTKTTKESSHPSVSSTTTEQHTTSVTQSVYKHSISILPFDPQHPSIMGLHLGETENSVIYLYGDTTDKYIMEDPTDPITVYEYSGFSVGFNKKKQVEYITILSKNVNPGLNGLFLGQQGSKAIQSLGNPTTNTKYVLAYHYDQILLKLDIDPKTNTILSIKMFPLHSSS